MWISLSERLPKKEEGYILIQHNVDGCPSVYQMGGKDFTKGDALNYHVTDWMSIPDIEVGGGSSG